MDDLNSTQGIVALAAAGLGWSRSSGSIVLAVKLRRVRAAQRTILGGEETDLVAHAASLQEAFVQLRDWVEEIGRRARGAASAPPSSGWTAASPTPR